MAPTPITVFRVPGGGLWQCGACGFTNDPKNNVCGGIGRLGCKQPRPESDGVAPVRPKPENIFDHNQKTFFDQNQKLFSSKTNFFKPKPKMFLVLVEIFFLVLMIFFWVLVENFMVLVDLGFWLGRIFLLVLFVLLKFFGFVEV